MSRQIVLREFERLYSDDARLSKEDFEQLRQFTLSRGEEKRVLTIGCEKRREYISSRNYVGLLTLSSGLRIEILPKLPLSPRPGGTQEEDDQRTREFFFQMLQTCGVLPRISMNWSGLGRQQADMLECFYAAFMENVQKLVRQGLASGYHDKTENEHFLKGRLDIGGQIRHNLAHRERFYVTYDVFDVNRAKNRLLKTALSLVARRTSSLELRRQGKMLLEDMDAIPLSTDVKTDFMRCREGERSVARYGPALAWCRLFLLGESFTTFSGDCGTQAILFPMERVFQDYVAAELRRSLPREEWEVRTQAKQEYLFYQEGYGRFLLKPDICVIHKGGTGGCLVMDTKWKRLDAAKRYFGISQADMYQMYAYGKKYHAPKVTLLYPCTYTQAEAAAEQMQLRSWRGKDMEASPVTVQIKFVKLDALEGLADYVRQCFKA